MANINCPSYVQASTARVTRLTSCGEPDLEATCGYAVSDGWIQISATPNVEDPDEFKQKNASGKYLVNQRSLPLLNWVDLTIQFQRVDFELWNMITGNPIVFNDASSPLAIGTGLTESSFATANFSLETWMNNSEEECDSVGLPFYGYNLWPWVVEGYVSEEVVIANDLITFTVAGRTRRGTPWDVGPYDVLLDTAGDPSPLFEPIPTDAHWWGPIQTQIAPPEPACGCSALPAS